MESLLAVIRDLFSQYEDLDTFESFTNQAAFKVAKGMGNGESSEKFFPKDIFSGEVSDRVNNASIQKFSNIPPPEYDVQPKKQKDIINPKTGRNILRGGPLYYKLLKEGWIDENGTHLKTHKVKRVKNPKSNKYVTLGTKRFVELVEEGWFDEEGNALKSIGEDGLEIIN